MSKSTRDERRAARVAAEHAAATAALRRRRAWRLAAAAGVAAVLVGIGAAVSASGGPATAKTTGAAAAVVRGIPEHDGVLGDPKAPVTVTEYVDLQCPVCAAASRDTLPGFIKTYVRTGKVKLQVRTLSFLGPDSVRAAKVAAGAERQGRLWSFLETFYASQGDENSGYVTDDFLREIARAAGVDADAALKFADGSAAQAPLDQANAEGSALGVESTPTFTVKRGDGAETIAAVGVDDLKAKLDAAVAG